MQPIKHPKDDGFALVTVVLTLGFLAAIAASFSINARSHIRDAAAVIGRAKAESLADGGVYLAIFDALAARETPRRMRRFPLSGSPTVCRAGVGILEIAMADEAGRVDLNAAPQALLEALLRGSGLDSQAAVALAGSLIAYRSPGIARTTDQSPGQSPRAVADPGAPFSQGSKRAALDAFEEIFNIGFAPASLLAGLRPLVTIHSGQAGVDPDAASPELLRRLLVGSGNTFDVMVADAEIRNRFRRQLPQFVGVGRQRKFGIRATASIDGAVFVREAVVEIVAGRAPTYAIRTWRQGTRTGPAHFPSIDTSC
jgi:type II secretory pathway component PulK